MEVDVTPALILIRNPFLRRLQTWVNYTEKISIELQLLKQSVNYKWYEATNYNIIVKESQLNYSYNYTKLNPT